MYRFRKVWTQPSGREAHSLGGMSFPIRVILAFRGNRTPFGSELSDVTLLDLLPSDDRSGVRLAARPGALR